MSFSQLGLLEIETYNIIHIVCPVLMRRVKPAQLSPGLCILTGPSHLSPAKVDREARNEEILASTGKLGTGYWVLGTGYWGLGQNISTYFL